MISMVVQALYNVVDSIFVSWLSEDALAAVTLAFPFRSLMIAFGAGLGVGVNALLSRSLGEESGKCKGFRDPWNDDLRGRLSDFFIDRNLSVTAFYGQSDRRVGNRFRRRGVSFHRLRLFFRSFRSVSLRETAAGYGTNDLSMITQSVGAVINIILDPILISAFWELRRWVWRERRPLP